MHSKTTLANGRSARGRLPAELVNPAFAKALWILNDAIPAAEPDDLVIATSLCKVGPGN